MSYRIECQVALRSLKTLRDLSTDSISYDTQLLLLKRHMAKVRAIAPTVISPEHLQAQSFLDDPETRKRLVEASSRVRQIARGHTPNPKAVRIANHQVRSFHRNARRGKRLGVGYGQVHKPVRGGAPQ
jgi:hypothetical protein